LKEARSRRRHAGKGELFIVSAPSGTGKTTLCLKLCTVVKRLKHSVSYTTRAPRRNERNNVHYSFVSREKFMSMIRKREFAEWATVHGNLYGTSVKKLTEIIKKGYDVILDIDVHGARQMKNTFKDAVFIFILPPSMKILEKRLRARMSDDPEKIKNRLRNAKSEIAHYRDYDYIVINRDLKKALKEMESIIISKRLMTAKVDSGLIKNLK
jgi:guanylate kinase